MQAQGHAAEEAFGEGLGERIGLRRSGNGGGQPVADLGDIELIAQGDALHPLALAAGVGGVASQGAARRVDQRDGVALPRGEDEPATPTRTVLLAMSVVPAPPTERSVPPVPMSEGT